MTSCFEAVVQSVGGEVAEFLAGRTLIFFGPEAPPELREVSVLLFMITLNSSPILVPGNHIQIGQTTLRIMQTGEVAEDNLRTLTHLVLVASDQEILPGQVAVEGKWPGESELHPGVMVQILANEG